MRMRINASSIAEEGVGNQTMAGRRVPLPAFIYEETKALGVWVQTTITDISAKKKLLHRLDSFHTVCINTPVAYQIWEDPDSLLTTNGIVESRLKSREAEKIPSNKSNAWPPKPKPSKRDAPQPLRCAYLRRP